MWRLIVTAALLLGCGGAAAQLANHHAKCSACRAVADELVHRLEKEVPRNHLDLRHRLDKEGKRWGKVIDYKMSELRVIDLLEKLCDVNKQYELTEETVGGETRQRWVRSAELGAARGDFQEVREQRKLLEIYCHDLLERHEDELSEALRGGKIDPDTASDFLCLSAARHCSTTLAKEQAERARSRKDTSGDGTTSVGSSQEEASDAGEAVADDAEADPVAEQTPAREADKAGEAAKEDL